MANQHREKLRGVRGVDDDLWADLHAAATALGTDRSAITRQLWEWWLKRPGATLPPPPPTTE
ncbi:hypothetical protein ACQEU5_25040 [Marinactinospora thermotolerans]|uniref:hypothetical protein n=1 Tax=Marinactinospora thermotolerans TaxID=531310 RepID=UPI003D94041D